MTVHAPSSLLPMSLYALLALSLWLVTVFAAVTVMLFTRRSRRPATLGPEDVPALGRWLRRRFASDPAGARRAAAVAAHARWLGDVVGLTRVEHGHVYVAALLHGVESLDAENLPAWEHEDVEVQVLAASHRTRGVHMLRDIAGLEPAARIAAACGERVDGSGFPRGLRATTSRWARASSPWPRPTSTCSTARRAARTSRSRPRSRSTGSPRAAAATSMRRSSTPSPPT